MFINQNSQKDNIAITILTKEKKSQKAKFFNTFLIKKVVPKAKYLAINDFVNNLINIMGLIFLQGTKD